MNITTGVVTDVVIGQETSFGQLASSIDMALGYESKYNYSVKKNYKPFHDLGQRTFITAEDLKFEGSWDADFVLANEHFWPFVLGDGDGTGGTPFVFDTEGIPKSFSAKINDRHENKWRPFHGHCVNDFTMSGNVGDEIKCKLSGLFASIGVKQTGVSRASLSIDGVTAGTDIPMTYAMADVKISSTSNYFGLLQKFELKVSNDLQFYWGFNGRYAHTPKFHKAIGGLTMGIKKSDSSTKQMLDEILAGATGAENITVVITITDGTRTITMTMAGTYINDFSTSYEFAADIDENLTFIFSTISVVLAGY